MRRLTTMLPKPKEHDLHRAVADILATALGPPGITNQFGTIWFSIEHAEPHEGARKERVRRGVTPGVPDILVLHDGIARWAELKRPGGGRTSVAQRHLHPQLRAAGSSVVICQSVEDMLAALRLWGITPRVGVRFDGVGASASA